MVRRSSTSVTGSNEGGGTVGERKLWKGPAAVVLAVGQGAKVIDYDRLVVGSKASYYVSFNNVTVGKYQGRGLVAGLKAKKQYGKHPVIAELNGDVKDNNAKLFKRGTTRS